MEINFLENKSLLTHHLSLIDSYRHLIVGSDSIKAAVIVGSFARGNPDRFSDIDLVAFAEKDCFELAAQELFEPKFFPTMHTFGKDFTPNVKFKKTIYDNFVSAEIHLFSSTFDFKLRKPYI
ncbi:MAG: nucleotidyltransferase domain-containing protein, partial [Pseudobdellovibrionaceae bacterium]